MMKLRWLTACVLAAACGDSGSGGGPVSPPPGDCPTPVNTGGPLMGPCNVKPELSCQYGHLDCGTPITSGRLAYSRCVDGEWRLASTSGACPPPGGSGGAGNAGSAGKGGAGKGGTMQQGGTAGESGASGQGGEGGEGLVSSAGAAGEGGSP
jgi:hypothetical protein